MRYAVRRNMRMARVNRPYAPEPGARSPSLLYVHIPFCETLCPYCSFHRVRFEPGLATDYFRSLRREAELYKQLGFEFRAVYVGGGTPTVLPEELAALLDFLRDLWPVTDVSVETHCHHLTEPKLRVLEGAAIDRLSVGVQTFDDGLLRQMSRLDSLGTADETRRRLQRVNGLFPTLNVDMIFNLPGQTLTMLRDDIRTIRALGVDQVTFYPLMEGRPDFERAFGPSSARREALFFRQIVADLEDAYEPASAWCFSRREGMGDEYIVSHDQYAGLGSGAFGYSNGVLYANTFDVGQYIECLARSELPVVALNRFGVGDRMRYDLLMQLFGGSLDVKRLSAKYGRLHLLGLCKEILFLLLTGSLSRQAGRLVPTARGRYYLVVLMKEFFGGVNRLREFMAQESGT